MIVSAVAVHVLGSSCIAKYHELIIFKGGPVKRFRVLMLLVCVFFVSPSFADWFSLATDANGVWGLSISQQSKRKAESQALKECASAKGVKCAVVGTSSQTGYVALATSKTSVRAYLDDSLGEAKRSALSACVNFTDKDDVCTVVWTGFNGRELELSSVPLEKNCRPRTSHLTCQSKCVNGDCVVEYKNGCKMHIKVSPRFDPLSNQWIYPSPSC